MPTEKPDGTGQPKDIADMLMEEMGKNLPEVRKSFAPRSEVSGISLEEEKMLSQEERPYEDGVIPSPEVRAALAVLESGKGAAPRPVEHKAKMSEPKNNGPFPRQPLQEHNDLLPPDVKLSELSLEDAIRRPVDIKRDILDAPIGPLPEADVMDDEEDDINRYMLRASPRRTETVKPVVAEKQEGNDEPMTLSYVAKEDVEEEWKQEMHALSQIKEEKPILESDDYDEALARLVESRRQAPDDYMPPLAEDSVLYQICAKKYEHIEKRRGAAPESILLERIRRMPQPRDFLHAIKKKIELGQVPLIAEIKKASPSKGVIREDFKPMEIAKAYTQAGATCLSVLTDGPYFQGRDEYINMVRTVTSLPILRKDFILDPYQVVEARFIGADCILLIMAAVSDRQAKDIEAKARQMNMTVLVEVHNEEELQRALKLQTKFIGINNRDLKTLKIDLSTTERLAQMIPPGYVIVCESGISSYREILRMQEADDNMAFLVGESLMVQDDILKATKTLLNID